MHIPDGLLSVPVSLACSALSAVSVGAAALRSRLRAGSRAAALVGVMAAFVFTAQMINFPVAGGTSGHLVGGVLTAVLLGPTEAVVVMTAVLVMQCFVFGDGGILSMGANILNMAVVHPLAGFAVYAAMVGGGGSGSAHARPIAAIAFASWAATVLAALTCAGELSLSGIVAATVVVPAMLAVHAIIGLGEAMIAAIVLATILRLRPELLQRRKPKRSVAATAVLGLVVPVALALFVSPFACTWPDGLERVVERLGVSPSSARITLSAPLRGYAIPGFGRSTLSTSLAALLGTLLVFALCCAVGFWLSSRGAKGMDPTSSSGPPP